MLPCVIAFATVTISSSCTVCTLLLSCSLRNICLIKLVELFRVIRAGYFSVYHLKNTNFEWLYFEYVFKKILNLLTK